MKYTIFSFFFLMSFTLIGQNLIFVGDNAYHSTPDWRFDSGPTQFRQNGDIAIIKVGKKEHGGIFYISTKTFMANVGIKGPIRVYFDDASTIVLNQILTRDYSDGYSIVIYELSSSDIQKLKTTQINAVRFNHGFADMLEGSTVKNQWDRNPDPIIYDPKPWNTVKDVMELFGEEIETGIGNVKTNMMNTQIDYLYLDQETNEYQTRESIKVLNKAYLSKKVFWVKTETGTKYFHIKQITLQEDKTTYQLIAQNNGNDVIMMYINKDDYHAMCVFSYGTCDIYHLRF